MKDLNYLMGYALPVTAIFGLYLRGPFVFLTPIFAFILIPLLELILPQNNKNLSPDQALAKEANPFFDILLYLNIPLTFGISLYFLWSLDHATYSILEIVGLTVSIGIAMGSNGINVAHELGHRKNLWERILGKLLLLPSFYMHFFIDHNFGHHLHVGTQGDATTARYNQSVYAFWIQAVFGEYRNAWRLQKDLLKRKWRGFLSPYNDMLWFGFFQLGYAFGVWWFFGWLGVLLALCMALISVLLLETINYIEHYGLFRKQNASGRYERVREIHSWNSNHIMGRMMLYELTRHSDHHHRAHKKYQLLDYHETSPELPYGYPTSMVLALIPPIWFQIMNPRIPSEMQP